MKSLCWMHTAHRYQACFGVIQAAHMIPKQRLTEAGCPEEDLWDKRILRPICKSHHHSLDKKFIRLDKDDYPDSTLEYAEEYGWWYDDSVREWKPSAATPSLYAERKRQEAMSLLEEDR